MLNADDQTKYKQLYLYNASNYINDLKTNLNALKQGENIDSASNIHRFSHSLKSTSLVMGYHQAAAIASAIENIFYQIKLKNYKITSELQNLLVQSFTNLENDLNNIRTNNTEIDLTQDLERLETMTNIKSNVKIV